MAVAMALSSMTPTSLQVLNTGLPDSTAACSGGAPEGSAALPTHRKSPRSQDTPMSASTQGYNHPLGTFTFRPLLLILQTTSHLLPLTFHSEFKSLLVLAWGSLKKDGFEDCQILASLCISYRMLGELGNFSGLLFSSL